VASEIEMPQLTASPLSPTPRNDSVASLAMLMPSRMVSTTTYGAIAFGRTCRKISRPGPAPTILAAAT
jgi:hypothetical protein